MNQYIIIRKHTPYTIKYKFRLQLLSIYIDMMQEYMYK